MVSIYSDVSSTTGMSRAIRELIKIIENMSDSSGLIPGSFSYLQKEIDGLASMISGLSRSMEGLQRLGLHDMAVSIVAPVSGSTINGSRVISGTYTDQSGHSMISGCLLVSGVFHTGLTFPASGYWSTTLDTTKYANETIPVKVQVVCAAGTSKESAEISYKVNNIIAKGGTTQAGSAVRVGDVVSLSLNSPGQAIGSFNITGSFGSTAGHAIQSVQATSNTDRISLGTPTWQGYGISVPCNVGDWGGVGFGIVSVTITDIAGCVASASVRVYNPTPPYLPGS